MFNELKKALGGFVDPYNKQDKFIPGGYNVGFDMGFLQQLWRDMGDKYFWSWFAFGDIDPKHAIRFFEYAGITFPVGAKLTEIADYLGVLKENAHDALVDVEMTINVTKKLLEYVVNADQKK